MSDKAKKKTSQKEEQMKEDILKQLKVEEEEFLRAIGRR